MVVVALAVGAGLRPDQRVAHRVRQDRAVHHDPGHAGQRPRPRRDHQRQEDPDRPRSKDVRDFFNREILGIDFQIWLFALVAVVGWILLNRTTFGRRTVAVGGNPEAARLAGINVKRHTVYLYVLIGRLLRHRRADAGRQDHHGQLDARQPLELDAIAAVVIGGTLLTGGRGTIVGTVLGVLIFQTLTNIFILNNRSFSEQQLLKGVIIVAAVLLQQRLASRSKT